MLALCCLWTVAARRTLLRSAASVGVWQLQTSKTQLTTLGLLTNTVTMHLCGLCRLLAHTGIRWNPGVASWDFAKARVMQNIKSNRANCPHHMFKHKLEAQSASKQCIIQLVTVTVCDVLPHTRLPDWRILQCLYYAVCATQSDSGSTQNPGEISCLYWHLQRSDVNPHS
jgi:hypothetical protein